jgi:hypothetical protein
LKKIKSRFNYRGAYACLFLAWFRTGKKILARMIHLQAETPRGLKNIILLKTLEGAIMAIKEDITNVSMLAKFSL